MRLDIPPLSLSLSLVGAFVEEEMEILRLRVVHLWSEHLDSNLSSDLLVALGCLLNMPEPQSSHL